MNRHRSAGSARAAIEQDIRATLAARAFLAESIRIQVLPGRGRLRADVQLRFATELEGPLLLGKGHHRGQGYFVPAD
ncbi:MAG: hypothetical protein U5R48_02865 [Gammaproteobacteria bacterium]|nr:hypothetical protein [Gammaproteobacteria bacterium]